MDVDAFADAAKSRVGSDQSRQRAFVTVLLLCHLQSKLQKLSTQNYTVFLLPTQPNLCAIPFFLEDADHDRRIAIHALLLDFGNEARRQRLLDPRHIGLLCSWDVFSYRLPASSMLLGK